MVEFGEKAVKVVHRLGKTSVKFPACGIDMAAATEVVLAYLLHRESATAAHAHLHKILSVLTQIDGVDDSRNIQRTVHERLGIAPLIIECVEDPRATERL